MKLTRLFPASLLGAAIAATTAPYSFAQDTTLDTIVVSATRSEQSENIAPAMISVITSEQIANSGAQTVADVLRSSGAVQLKDTIGDNSRVTVSMRGFSQNSSNNVLIMIDGRRLNNPTLEAPNLNSISIQDIERIEITQGSAGSLYGEQAVGGVINIITKSTATANNRIQLSAGSFDQQRLQLGLGQRYDNGLGLRFSGDTRNSNGYRDNNEAGLDTFSGELSYQYDSGEVFVEAQQINDNLLTPGALNDSQLASNRQQSVKTGEFFNQDIKVQRLGIEQELNENLSLIAEMTERNGNGNGAYLLSGDLYGYDQDTHVRSYAPRLAGEWQFNDRTLYLTTGIDRIESDYQIDYGFGASNKEQTIKAVYFQTIIPTADNIDLTLGARRSKVKDSDLVASSSRKDAVTVKEIGLSYRIDEQHRVFLRRDENFRFANNDENGLTLPAVDFLDTQEGVSWELGWQYNRQDVRFVSTLYRLDLSNEIYYDPIIANPASYSGVGANVNLDDTRRQGLILEVSYDIQPALTIGSTYTYTDAELSSGSFSGNQVPYVAEHTLSLFGDYRINQQWNLFVDGQYTGSRYQDDDYANIQQKVDDQLIVNTTIGWQKDQWQASLRVNNLTDKKHDSYTIYSAGSNHYSAPERNVLLTVGYNF